MAKKAPATPAKKPPAKRKPRPKKPVDVITTEFGKITSEDLQRAIESLKKPAVPIVDPTDYSTPVIFPSWLTGGLKAIALLTIGVLAGIWIAGGIEIGPDNKPEPVPTPIPEPVKSFRAIFVKESGQTLSSEQVAIPGAKEIRDFLNAKTTAEGNQPGWREFDPQQITDNEQPTMKALWGAVKPKLLPAPCLVIEVNGKATVMPFPATVAEAVETLKKHGGA